MLQSRLTADWPFLIVLQYKLVQTRQNEAFAPVLCESEKVKNADLLDL